MSNLLRRVYLHIFRHHLCQVCLRARPIWMRGNHTSCIEAALYRAYRAELRRLEEE